MGFSSRWDTAPWKLMSHLLSPFWILTWNPALKVFCATLFWGVCMWELKVQRPDPVLHSPWWISAWKSVLLHAGILFEVLDDSAASWSFPAPMTHSLNPSQNQPQSTSPSASYLPLLPVSLFLCSPVLEKYCVAKEDFSNLHSRETSKSVGLFEADLGTSFNHLKTLELVVLCTVQIFQFNLVTFKTCCLPWVLSKLLLTKVIIRIVHQLTAAVI